MNEQLNLRVLQTIELVSCFERYACLSGIEFGAIVTIKFVYVCKWCFPCLVLRVVLFVFSALIVVYEMFFLVFLKLLDIFSGDFL